MRFSPRRHWPKGIAQKIYPNRNGIIRLVEVKTASGCLRRKVRKLRLLKRSLIAKSEMQFKILCES